MKRVYLTISLFVMMILSIGHTTAFAADWYYVGEYANGNRSVYIDNASVIKGSQRAIVWVKYAYTDGSMDLQRHSYTHSPKTVTLLSYVSYDSDGNVTASFDAPPDMWESSPIVPGSVGEAIWYCIWSY